MKYDEKEEKIKERVEYDIKAEQQRKSMLVYKRTEEIYKSTSFISKARKLRDEYTEEGEEEDAYLPSFPAMVNPTLESVYIDTATEEARDQEE